MTDHDNRPDEAESYDSWDAFWAEIEGDEKPVTETIRGVTVTVPTELTVRFTRRAEKLQDSSRVEDLTSLLADLFGTEPVEGWIEAGMSLLEFQTVLAWSIAHASGKPITFRQALEQVRKLSAARAEGKAKR